MCSGGSAGAAGAAALALLLEWLASAHANQRYLCLAASDLLARPPHPGGSLYARNPPMPKEMVHHPDFGREGFH